MDLKIKVNKSAIVTKKTTTTFNCFLFHTVNWSTGKNFNHQDFECFSQEKMSAACKKKKSKMYKIWINLPAVFKDDLSEVNS